MEGNGLEPANSSWYLIRRNDKPGGQSYPQQKKVWWNAILRCVCFLFQYVVQKGDISLGWHLQEQIKKDPLIRAARSKSRSNAMASIAMAELHSVVIVKK